MSGGASANMVQGNFIQVLNDGVTPGASATNAVFIENGTTGNQIGGLTSTPGTGLGNVIGPCFIGIQAAGRKPQNPGQSHRHRRDRDQSPGNRPDRHALFGNASTTIGGPTADTRNVIAGCGGFAIQIDQGLTATPPNKNLVQNNFIGTDINGVPGSMGNGGECCCKVPRVPRTTRS